MRYLLEGAAARSETTTRVKLIEAALLKARIGAGDEPLLELLQPTTGYKRTFSETVGEAAAATACRAQQQALEQLRADVGLQTTLRAQIRRLQEAKAAAEEHRTLVSISVPWKRDVFEIVFTTSM